jgi:hypothetical protein
LAIKSPLPAISKTNAMIKEIIPNTRRFSFFLKFFIPPPFLIILIILDYLQLPK